jgi:3',5'-cyclic AMP phosphodiesterase CpdA
MLIAQITDFHIKPRGRLAYRKVDTAGFLAAAVTELTRLDPAPDVVLATGDLVDFGLPEEYELLRELTAPLEAPFYLVPGNHDDRDNLRRAFPELFPREGFLQYAIDAHALRIVALDTLIPRQSGGELCAERLAWLDATLAAAPERPTVVMMHHPPFLTGIRHMDAIGLTGRQGFAEVIARHPQVERILCGHLHRSIQAQVGGAIASTAPSTAHQVALDLRPDGPSRFMMEPPGYQLHLWRAGEPMVTHTAVIGSFAGPYPFFEEGNLIP